jgi:4-alpha-glucanotransferase
MSRRAGVLVPLFSLRSTADWGVGEIPDLVPFARWARSAGFGLVQLLPVNHASGGQDSPYSALSAFAIYPVYLSLEQCEDFQRGGGLGSFSDDERERLARARSRRNVPWSEVRALKERGLAIAFQSFLERDWYPRTERVRELEAFAKTHGHWLPDYALFVALHEEQGNRTWQTWPEALRTPTPAVLEEAHRRLWLPVLRHSYCQWQLTLQWTRAREQAHEAGVALMGDLPFVVSTDAADVWAHQDEFRLDARAGAPPDAFSKDGQDWGLPVYRWAVMQSKGLSWFRARGYRSAEMFDYYRVDHVVGLYRTYFKDATGKAAFTPSVEAEQKENGERVLKVLSERAKVIAEDLGVIPPFVRTSLTALGIPGYRVLRWERDEEVYRDPAAWPILSVATSGTHDTETTAEWFDALGEEDRKALLDIPGLASLREKPPAAWDDRVRDALLEVLYQSPSELLLIPFQDAVGSRERVNIPGTLSGDNWTYRLAQDMDQLAADAPLRERLASLSRRSNRL